MRIAEFRKQLACEQVSEATALKYLETLRSERNVARASERDPRRSVAVGTSIMTIIGIVLYSTIALLPLFLQTMLGYPAVQSGMAVSPRGSVRLRR